jgi:hypothetical protein
LPPTHSPAHLRVHVRTHSRTHGVPFARGGIFPSPPTQVLTLNGIKFQRQEAFVLMCNDEKQKVHFEMEICKMPRLSMHGIKHRRIGGDSVSYKDVCSKVRRPPAQLQLLTHPPTTHLLTRHVLTRHLPTRTFTHPPATHLLTRHLPTRTFTHSPATHLLIIPLIHRLTNRLAYRITHPSTDRLTDVSTHPSTAHAHATGAW